MFDESLVEELFSTEWFRRCGNPPPPLPFACSQVGSWAEACTLSSAIDWENTTLEARNELTDILHKSQPNQMQDWNDITNEAKAQIVFPLTEKYWKSFATENGLGKPFIDCVQWDILAACMESAYDQPRFFTELLKVYRAGHFPCGWASGEYPNGNLVIW